MVGRYERTIFISVVINALIFESPTVLITILNSYQFLPEGLREIFDNEATSTWVLFRVGSKAWPIRVVENVFEYGWNDFCNAHKFNDETKLILGTERQWIFDVIVLDQQDDGVDFSWSKGHNTLWQTPNVSEGTSIKTLF